MDDALKADVEGMMRAGHSTHAQDWKDPEPPADDEPEIDRAPDTALSGAAPGDMTADDLELRSQLAGAMAGVDVPADRDRLLEHARTGFAPDRVLRELERLPAGQQFTTAGEVWSALGHPADGERF